MVRGILKSRAAIAAAFTMSLTLNSFAQTPAAKNACRNVPTHSHLKAALKKGLSSSRNGGLNNNMWGTVVNRDGVVGAVVFTGVDRDDQWPGSRVISAQKANTANAFSLSLSVRRGGGGFSPVDGESVFSGSAGRPAVRTDREQPGEFVRRLRWQSRALRAA